jgi:hypothetical protein
LKQLLRDRIDPSRDLGHSDKGGKKKDAVKTGDEGKVEEKSEEGVQKETEDRVLKQAGQSEKSDVKWDDNASTETGYSGGIDVKGNADGTICEDCR